MGSNKLTKTLYLVFGDARYQSDSDLEDLCQNIKRFDTNCDIIINHPESNHPNVLLRHRVQPVNYSTFIFGVFIEFINWLKENPTEFDHVCLFSANQYMINSFYPLKDINYVQFYNTPNWDHEYTGKDFTNTTIGNPLIQYETFNWDNQNMHVSLGVPSAMVSNWEFAHLSHKTIELCKEHLNACLEIYPNKDVIQLFPGFMALKSKQPWFFPPFFGTFDPSNKINNHNWIITEDQIKEKHNQGYCSVKRVNYTKDCPLKQYIKENIL